MPNSGSLANPIPRRKKHRRLGRDVRRFVVFDLRRNKEKEGQEEEEHREHEGAIEDADERSRTEEHREEHNK